VPVNSLMERFKPDTDPGKQTKVCPECKSSIPYDATRCAFCTVVQPPLADAMLKTGAGGTVPAADAAPGTAAGPATGGSHHPS
jgi:ribosomal protein L40E